MVAARMPVVAAILAALIVASVLAGWALGVAALLTVIPAALGTCIVLALLRSIRDISRSYTPAVDDTGHMRIVDEARAARQAELDALNKELEELTYSISHDLRAPLRHISGYVDLLTQALGTGLDDEPRRYLTVVAQASREMTVLIDALLSFSRITRSEPHLRAVEPRALVESVIAGREETQRRDIEWRISDMPRVEGDPALLKVVYANLIDNAVKFSVPSKPAVIEIGAAGEDAGRAVLFVRDNGVGFDMARAERLFGIFQRLHPAEDFAGTGIGLATVQRIIARHGGRVWAHAAPGAGATFCFTLAKSADAPISAQE
jgi:light-regulated signal transduction histidine kinase (bacteriophytochrome)